MYHMLKRCYRYCEWTVNRIVSAETWRLSKLVWGGLREKGRREIEVRLQSAVANKSKKVEQGG